MAYRMASRLIGGGMYGAVAGVCAFLALFSSNKYVRDAALGNSEPLLAALVPGDFFAAKGILEAMCNALGVAVPRFVASRGGPFHPTRGASLVSGTGPVGAFGELDPFTNMIWPSDMPDFLKATRGEFSGVGIQIQLDDDIASRWGPRIVDLLREIVAAVEAATS